MEKELAEHVSELADAYDPKFEADANDIRAFLQGTLAGLVMRNDNHMLVEDVAIGIDADGDYLHYFDVTFGSGAKVRVQVERLN